MAQTKEGAEKIAAAAAGVSLGEYQRRRAAGEKWCYGCRSWLPNGAFRIDRSRGDGLTATCAGCRSSASKARYVPKPKKPRGWLVAARSGDKKQARRRINYLVEQGKIPRPNALPCTDCGHVWTDGERRHEYDHHRGYESETQLIVEPVCTTCHRSREKKRGEH